MTSWFRTLVSRFLALFRRKDLEKKLQEELDFHLEMQSEENLKNGMKPEEARRAALRSFGGLDQTKEKHRDIRSFRCLEDFIQDFRFGLRLFYRKPKYAIAAVIILALAIGPNTAAFSIIKGVLYRYMPYPDPDRIVEFNLVNPKHSIFMQAASFPDYEDFAKNNRSLESIAFYHKSEVDLSGTEEPLRARGVRATASLFDMLKRSPALGRVFTEEETGPGADPVVVLSHNLWKHQFAEDPNILGKRLSVDYVPHTIIGIMPEDFVFSDSHCILWLPFDRDPVHLSRGNRFGQILARLKPDVSVESAQNDLSRIAAVLERDYPDTNSGYTVLIREYFHIDPPQDSATAIPVLYIAVTFVFLIACANISTLLLARTSGRKKELSIRASLGSSRMRLLRQLLAENIVLALLGGFLGIFVALVWIKAILTVVPYDMPNQDRIGIDLSSLLYAVGITLLSCLVFGIFPALRNTGRSLMDGLKEASHSSIDRSRHHLLKGFVIVETSLAVVLLIASGLLVRSYHNEISINPGFDHANLLTVRLALSESMHDSPEQLNAFVETTVNKFKAHPGILMVAAAEALPMTGGGNYRKITIQKQSSKGLDQEVYICRTSVTPDYFRTLRIPLLQGRYFSDSDNQSHSFVIISEIIAKRYLSDTPNPLGRMIRFGSAVDPDPKWMEIIGVVGDVCLRRLRDTPMPQIYTPYGQQPSRHVGFVVRTENDPLQYSATAKNLIRSVDPEQPLHSIASMERIIEESASTPRAISRTMSALSVFALILAAFGIYSIVSYAVSERTNEIGIRLAFGAQRKQIFRMIISQGLMHLGIGLCVGIIGAIASMKFLGNLLYGVTPGDPISYTGTGIILFTVGILAMLLPLRRAVSIDPMMAIRHE